MKMKMKNGHSQIHRYLVKIRRKINEILSSLEISTDRKPILFCENFILKLC
jgi:hypothetical protein